MQVIFRSIIVMKKLSTKNPSQQDSYLNSEFKIKSHNKRYMLGFGSHQDFIGLRLVPKSFNRKNLCDKQIYICYQKNTY